MIGRTITAGQSPGRTDRLANSGPLPCTFSFSRICVGQRPTNARCAACIIQYPVQAQGISGLRDPLMSCTHIPPILLQPARRTLLPDVTF